MKQLKLLAESNRSAVTGAGQPADALTLPVAVCPVTPESRRQDRSKALVHWPNGWES